MKKYFVRSVIVLSIFFPILIMCMDDEHTQSVIWFKDKNTQTHDCIRMPFITRLAKEQVEFYNSQKIPMVLSVEELGPDWKKEKRFRFTVDFVVSSYQDCIEIRPAQIENMSYKQYLDQYKNSGHFDEMIIAMAADSYYNARKKNNNPPYPLGSAVNLGFALHKLGKHLNEKIFRQFVCMVGWEPNKEDIPAIVILWRSLCSREQIYIDADHFLVLSKVKKDQTQPYLLINRSECIRYIATVLGMVEKELEGLFAL